MSTLSLYYLQSCQYEPIVEASAHSFVSQLRFAQRLAQVNQTTTLVCPTKDGKQCDSNWQHQFMVAEQIADTLRPHSVYQLPKVQVDWQAHTPDKIQFNRQGRLHYQGTLTFSLGKSAQFWVLLHSGFFYRKNSQHTLS